MTFRNLKEYVNSSIDQVSFIQHLRGIIDSVEWWKEDHDIAFRVNIPCDAASEISARVANCVLDTNNNRCDCDVVYTKVANSCNIV